MNKEAKKPASKVAPGTIKSTAKTSTAKTTTAKSNTTKTNTTKSNTTKTTTTKTNASKTKDVNVDKRAFISHEAPPKPEKKEIVKKTNMKCIRTIEAHKDWIEQVVMVNNYLVTCAEDGSVKVWDITKNDNKPLVSIPQAHNEAVMGLCQCTKDSILTVSKDKTIRKFALSTGKEIFCYKTIQPLYCIFKIDDSLYAVGGSDAIIRIYDFSKEVKEDEDGNQVDLEVQKYEGHTKDITCFEMASGGRLISSSMDNTIKIWDLNQKRLMSTLADHTNGVKCLKVLKNGNLASGGYDNLIKIWDLTKYICVHTLKGHNGHIISIAQLLDERIISAATDWSMIVWDVEKEKEDFCLEGHEEAVYSVVALEDGKVVSGSTDMTLKIWD